MGPRVMRRPPKYVQGFIDRHGKPRFYFRRPGFKRLPLPGLPWSPEFMAAYEAVLAEAPRLAIGARRTRPGTVAAAVAGYFGSAAFAMGAETTRRTRRQILEKFRAEHGDKGIAALGRAHVSAWLALELRRREPRSIFWARCAHLCGTQSYRVCAPTIRR